MSQEHEQLSFLSFEPDNAESQHSTAIENAPSSTTGSFPESQSPKITKDTGFLTGLNERQRDAVLAPSDIALQVLAGAGTGKTELISRRFVKLVRDFQVENRLDEDSTPPQERILVVTFTSDAATSMRERIHQRLVDNSEDGLGPDAWISTFHQFCMRLLRAHPLELGLPPDFVIFNPLQQEVLFSRVVNAVLTGEHPDLSDLFAQSDLAQHLPPDILSLECLQQSGLRDVENLLSIDRVFSLVNRIKTAGLSPLEFFQIATAQTRHWTERLQTMPTPHNKALKAPENMLLKIEAWVDALRPWAAAEWNPIGNAEEKAEAAGKKVTASTYKDELPSLAKMYLMPRTFEPISPDTSLLDEALAQEHCLVQIVTAIYALYQQALLAQGACDFDDLINHSITLLTRYPQLQTRYRQHFKAIIVDEFQDSNGSQLRLLELLIHDGAKNLTVVGDEKQSIYAFRFAQPENLDLIFRHGPYQKINLQTNYRSRPPVLAVANHLTTLMTSRPNQALQACDSVASETEPQVTWVDWDEMRESDSGKPSAKPIDASKASEARFIALEIARLVQAEDCPFSDIAILVKSHVKAEAIQQELGLYNIPSVRQKNLGFFQESVIKDTMALLRLMRSLGDEHSLVRILQAKLNQKQLRDLLDWKRQLQKEKQASILLDALLLLNTTPTALPILPLPVAEALGDLAFRLATIRKTKARLSAVQLFLNLAKAVGLIDPRLPEWRQKQQRITLRMFEKLLHLFSQGRPLQPTLEEVVETLERYEADPSLELPVSEELSGEDAVRIMTVYASKGLEFPIVFAAYTETNRVSRGGDATILFDPQYGSKPGFGLILGKVNGRANLKRELYQKCWFNPRAEKEAQRVFYVALTRARKRLYVLRAPQSFPWTAPDGYPSAAIRIISETQDADFLETHYWQTDTSTLRETMAALQEARKQKAGKALIPAH